MSRLPRVTLAIAVVAATLPGCSDDPEQRPQLIVHFDTDGPVPARPGSESSTDEYQPGLVDTLRVWLYGPDGERLDCAGCMRSFAVDEGLYRDGAVSLGVVSDRSERHSLRATLYSATRLDDQGAPVVSAAIDVAVQLAEVGDAVTHQQIDMAVEQWGQEADPSQPSPARMGQPGGSAVGQWASTSACSTIAGPAVPGLANDEVCVAGGAFIIGNHKFVGDYHFDAPEMRLVRINPFFLDVYEFTVARYRDALERGFIPMPGTAPKTWDGSNGCTLGLPADSLKPLTCLSWETAEALCRFDGRRLPTEAEWEFEASGRGESRIYPWGNSFDANCNNVVFARDAFFGGRCVVDGIPTGQAWVGSGLLDRSVSGVYDLGGNVSEYVADVWNRQSELCWAATTPYDNPLCTVLSPLDGDQRVVKGGTYTYDGDSLRVSRRTAFPLSQYVGSVGFRCARDDAP
ncbi:MAG: hypothetical protein DRI90_18830 [Deltaproteobacteria bacterium]|nr:MAG: hypothetical protein DRI90_18830 [Deltaproteobacteria bacterium]